jgi:hypothetical protein
MPIHDNSAEATAYLRDAMARAERELESFDQAIKEHGLRCRGLGQQAARCST